ncbi:hypothetical protein TNCT_577431 [Trichonephila clavata]|uniref:Uncharacterized protein n=1 Tax=Trichonephila clavata TaxID=2740835 RepID=A0A8X6GRV3_TRICU|nr:hypothetical protein TNCT_577431 [Trichonephila clavata]
MNGTMSMVTEVTMNCYFHELSVITEEISSVVTDDIVRVVDRRGCPKMSYPFEPHLLPSNLFRSRNMPQGKSVSTGSA